MNKLDSNSDMYRIVGCAFAVYNTLKAGYLESVYEKALEYELLETGFSVQRQVRIPVFYNGVDLKRDFYADIVVNNTIIIELKAVSSLRREHEVQLRSYLKATNRIEGLLINFGNLRKVEWRAVSL